MTGVYKQFRLTTVCPPVIRLIISLILYTCIRDTSSRDFLTYTVYTETIFRNDLHDAEIVGD